MTEELAKALRDGNPPFHGVTLSLEKLSLLDLWHAYSLVARVLMAETPSEEFVSNGDWHWHDGYVQAGKTLTRDQWERWLISPVWLACAWEAEDYVHRAVNPPDMSWYVRFYLWEYPEERDGYGLDVSGDSELIARFEEIWSGAGSFKADVQNSQILFELNGSTLEGKWARVRNDIPERER